MILIFVCILRAVSKHVVFTIATNYNESQIEPFVISARNCGFVGEIWIGVNANQLQSLASFASRYNVKLLDIEEDNNIVQRHRNEYRIVVLRHAIFSLWTRSRLLSDDDWILTADVRDSFFQRNPFLDKFLHDAFRLNLYAEAGVLAGPSQRLRSRERWTSRWMIDCFGVDVCESFNGKTIVNGGNQLGQVKFMRKMFDDVFQLARHRNDRCKQHDQPLLNYLFHRDNWNANTTTLWQQGTGAVNVLGLAKDLHYSELGLVLNRDGNTVSALVHQFDRVESLAKTYELIWKAAKQHYEHRREPL